jgi:hypothetical protein
MRALILFLGLILTICISLDILYVRKNEPDHRKEEPDFNVYASHGGVGQAILIYVKSSDSRDITIDRVIINGKSDVDYCDWTEESENGPRKSKLLLINPLKRGPIRLHESILIAFMPMYCGAVLSSIQVLTKFGNVRYDFDLPTP